MVGWLLVSTVKSGGDSQSKGDGRGSFGNPARPKIDVVWVACDEYNTYHGMVFAELLLYSLEQTVIIRYFYTVEVHRHGKTPKAEETS